MIPAMDKITALLNSKKKIHPAIAAALILARKKMDRYYSLTDSSSLYRIAMGVSSENDDLRLVKTLTSQFCTPA